jgi:DNA-directed RNA polymerase specialized sigma24 family protein
MSRVENFDLFYHGTRAALLHQTYALTGTIDGAASAVERGYAHAWSHWTKVAHLDDPLAWVRSEAWRVAFSPHLRRRFDRSRRRGPRAAESPYADHLHLLDQLTHGQRRVVVLRYLAGLSDDEIARQVGVTTTVAQNAATFGETIWSERADQQSPTVPLAQGLRELAHDTIHVTLMRAAAIRRMGEKRLRRHTLAGIAAATALLVGGGALISQQPSTGAAAAHAGGAGSTSGSAQQGSDEGSSKGAVSHEAPSDRSVSYLSSSDLLSLVDMRTLSKQHATWAIKVTSSGPLNQKGAYTWCQRRTLADPDAEEVVLRQFEALGEPRTSALQVVEQSGRSDAAQAAFGEMESWFATCDQPRVQLLRTYEVSGLGDEARVLVLRQRSIERQTFATVAIVRTGRLTSAVVAMTAGKNPIPPQRLAVRLGLNVAELCKLGDGGCDAEPEMRTVPALPLRTNPVFLSELDLPPVTNVRFPWAGVKPTRARNNPSATECDRATFPADTRPRARVFVIPDAKRMPNTFGLSETVGRFATPRGAGRFLEAADERVAGCSDRSLSATVTLRARFEVGSMAFRLWTFEFEVDEGRFATYRVGMARNGEAVAQVTLSPTEMFDVEPADFRALVIRAGERLTAME